MQFFTETDLFDAVSAMLESSRRPDPVFLGLMSGIKRRARTRAILAFAAQFDPPPPDRSIHAMKTLLMRLFGHAISNNDLRAHFATPGRKADDRVDLAKLDHWFEQQRPTLQGKAASTIRDLNVEWRLFTASASQEAARRRQAERVRRTIEGQEGESDGAIIRA